MTDAARQISEPWARLAGRFLVVDGPDGAGKSTQIGLLAAFLRGQGLAVKQTRDPGGTAIGDRIREILLDNAHGEMAVQCESMLYMASRAQLAAEVLRPALAAGECVLCDRYISSTVAYQGAGGADIAAIRKVADIAVAGLWPSLTILLDLPHDQGLGRAAQRGRQTLDRMESKGLEFHRRVRELFLQQAKDEPDKFLVVEAIGDERQVHSRLLEQLGRRVGELK
jgi:dTMP kinase